MVSPRWARIGRGETWKNVEEGGNYLAIANDAGAAPGRFDDAYSPARRPIRQGAVALGVALLLVIGFSLAIGGGSYIMKLNHRCENPCARGGTEFSIWKAHDKGEFFTPSSLVQRTLNVIKPERGPVFDLVRGSGGMVVQSSHFGSQIMVEMKRLRIA
jgi:hypothetical protein